MPKVLDFKDCLSITAVGKRHLLLGNGFSRACREDIFSYDSLFNAADFKGLNEKARSVFDRLGTTDFEAVMRALANTSEVLKHYTDNEEHEIAVQVAHDAQELKNVLVSTLSGHHPEFPSSITESEYDHCLKFISPFKRIYTVNYDLLLYWTTMRAMGHNIDYDDGFRDPFDGEPEDYAEEDYLAWTNFTHTQNIYYLHGALHLFYRGPELQKYCWSRTGIRLLEQINSALSDDLYPLIVAEGESDQKLERIRRSDYLGHALRSLGNIGGDLFIYGHSFSENDKHIFKQISQNKKIKRLFISIYGDFDSEANKRIVRTATGLAASRPEKKPLQILFYDSASASVWR